MPVQNVIASDLPFPGVEQPPKGSGGVLGKDDFLKLLIGQMKYHDPLNPMNGTEFAAQLAQFSGLEQLQNMNDNLTESLSTNYVLTSSINNALASNFVGKDVKAMSDKFAWSGGSSVKLGYILPEGASTVEVNIIDEAGNKVRKLRGSTSSGENVILWDGKNDTGGILDEGTYTIEVVAKRADSRRISGIKSFMFGHVQGVRYGQNGTEFIVDGVPVSLSEILEVFDGQG